MDFNLERIQASLAKYRIGHTIKYYPCVESTMALAQSAAQSTHIPSGLVILAEKQTQGRGRLSRKWDAPYGKALLLSVVIGPDDLPEPISKLTIAAAVAIRRSIIASTPVVSEQICIKWPNDVLGGPEYQKVGGILVESSFQANRPRYCIIGIGINVNQEDHELPPVPAHAIPPTSLKLLTGSTIDRSDLLVNLCESLSSLLRPKSLSEKEGEASRWLNEADQTDGPQLNTSKDADVHAPSDTPLDRQIWQEWRAHLQTIGQHVSVTTAVSQHCQRALANEIFSGIAVDVTQEGFLIVEDAQGQRRIFSSGEVTLRSRQNQQNVV